MTVTHVSKSSSYLLHPYVVDFQQETASSSSLKENTVESRFNEAPRDWGNWFVISRFFSIHYTITRLKISLVKPRTSLNRDSLNRGFTVTTLNLR